MKRNLVKSILTMAMVSAMFIGGSKMEANAMTIEEYASWGGITVADVKADPELMEFYNLIKNDDISLWMDGGSVSNTTAVAPTVVSGVAVSHPEMLALVNADRATNGAGALAWSTDLEVFLQQRVVEVMSNFQSAEYANAVATGAPTGAIAHKGSPKGMGENALWVSNSFSETAEVANADWIGSAGHHKARIKAGYTQYACASYVDPVTGQMIWVEVFSDGSYLANTSTFDYIRYATDYPDVALAFGQNSTALYNHYITCGKAEGRKAYYTNGTVIK